MMVQYITDGDITVASLPGGSIPIAHCEHASIPTIERDVIESVRPEQLCIDTCIVGAAQVFAYDAV